MRYCYPVKVPPYWNFNGLFTLLLGLLRDCLAIITICRMSSKTLAGWVSIIVFCLNYAVLSIALFMVLPPVILCPWSLLLLHVLVRLTFVPIPASDFIVPLALLYALKLLSVSPPQDFGILSLLALNVLGIFLYLSDILRPTYDDLLLDPAFTFPQPCYPTLTVLTTDIVVKFYK